MRLQSNNRNKCWFPLLQNMRLLQLLLPFIVLLPLLQLLSNVLRGHRNHHTSQFALPICKCLHANQKPSNTHGIVCFRPHLLVCGMRVQATRMLVALSANHQPLAIIG